MLSSEIVGSFGEPLTHDVDARWTMAYAAGLSHDGPDCFDTDARKDVLAHPLFPVCFEWPLFLDPRHLPSYGGLRTEERLRGVHATHDLVLHRPIRAGCRVTTRAQIVQVEMRRPGAYQLTRLESVDEQGRPLCTTWYGTIYRGVEVQGEDRCLEDALSPAREIGSPCDATIPLAVAANAAHVYTECARIWNPIHTDREVALRAGLPDIILHGTATLASAVSALLREHAGGDAEHVSRVACRFGAMVRMPSECCVRIRTTGDGVIGFEVLNDAGEPAIREGLLELRRAG